MKGPCLGLAAWLATVLLSPACRAGGFDALGVPLVHRVDLLADPGAAVRPGWHLRAAVREPFLGTGLREHVATVHMVRTTSAAAVQVAWQRSQVHRRLQWTFAVQHHLLAGRFGLGVQVQRWSFRNGATRSRCWMQTAWGMQLPGASHLSLQCAPQDASSRPRLTLQFETDHFAPFRLFFQDERVAGFPPRRRWGMTWGDKAFAVRVGFDALTASTSVGVSLAHRPWNWDAGARAHPILGWSRAAGIAWSP
jgi:hypothetical protein